MPYISLLILTFLNCCISVKTSPINAKPGNFVNLGVLFLCGSIVADTIIYRLVPSPSRFENRQFLIKTPEVIFTSAYVHAQYFSVFEVQETHIPFSSPEPTILLACGRNRELWEQPFRACAIDEG